MIANTKPPMELFRALGDNITGLTLERARALIAEDFVLLEVAGHPYGGSTRGPEGFVARMARLKAHEQAISFEMDCLLADEVGNVMFHGRMRVETPQGSQTAPVMERWRFANDKLAELVMCWHDPQASGALFRSIGMG
jgi:hypothetical protein